MCCSGGGQPRLSDLGYQELFAGVGWGVGFPVADPRIALICSHGALCYPWRPMNTLWRRRGGTRFNDAHAKDQRATRGGIGELQTLSPHFLQCKNAARKYLLPTSVGKQGPTSGGARMSPRVTHEQARTAAGRLPPQEIPRKYGKKVAYQQRA